MAKMHGRHTRIYLDGFDIGGDFNSFEPGFAADTVEVSGFGDDTKKYAVGLADPQIRLAGVYNDATDQAHEVSSARIGSLVMMNGLWGTLVGQFGAGGSVNLNEYSVSSGISAAVTTATSLSGGAGTAATGVFEFITTLLSKATIPTDPSGFQTNTQSNLGMSGHLQFFSGTGTVRIQSSPDDAAWTDRVDFGLQTAPIGVYGTSATGTVATFLRTILVAGTGTAWTGFKRF